MIELSGLDNDEDESFVKEQIARHVYWTGSLYAKDLLDNWAETRKRFVKILPVEYKRAIQQQKLAELDQKLYEIREREDITQKV
jgi:glutamate synthase (NADPH/NADH) large chain